MSFQKIADVYNRFNNLEAYEAWYDFTARRLMTEPEHHLDIACGTGYLTYLLSTLTQESVGIDIDRGMIEEAQSLEEASYLSFREMDMLNLDFPDKSFDLVTCYLDSFCFLANSDALLQAFKEVFRVMKPDGQFLFDVWQGEHLLNYFDGFQYSDVDEAGALIWHSQCLTGEAPFEVEHALTVFDLVEAETYHRLDLILTERTYELPLYQALLEEAGFAKGAIQLLQKENIGYYAEFEGRYLFEVKK